MDGNRANPQLKARKPRHFWDSVLPAGEWRILDAKRLAEGEDLASDILHGGFDQQPHEHPETPQTRCIQDIETRLPHFASLIDKELGHLQWREIKRLDDWSRSQAFALLPSTRRCQNCITSTNGGS